MKPHTIRRFDLLFPASIAAWLAATALSWDERQAMVARNPALVGYEWLVPASSAGVLALSLLIWLLVRRRSAAGRTMALVSGSLSFLALLIAVGGLAVGRSADPAASFASMLASALNIAAAGSLLAPASRAWFGGASAEALS